MTRKYKCPECGKLCATGVQLGSHRRWVHGVMGTSSRAVMLRERTRARAGEQVTQGVPEGAPKRGRKKLGRQEVRLVDAIGVLEHEVKVIERNIALLRAML